MSTIDKINVDGTVYDVAPGAGTVGTDALADGSVTTAKLGNDYITAFGQMFGLLETEATTKASATEYGRVKIGDGIDVTDGVISVSGTEVADGSVTTAKLADAAVTGDKIADAAVTGDKIADATVSMAKLATDVTGGLNVIASRVNTYASTTAYGRVKIGDGIDVTNGVISVTSGGSTYTLPAATADTLGGIKVGDGLSVTEDGTLSATGGGSSGGELADGSVSTAKLADSAVTSAKLANFCINRDSLFNQGVVTYSSLHDTVWAAIYPVGSVYCTTNASFDPNSYSFSWSSGGTTLTLGRKQKTSGTWELLDNDGTVYRWKRVK